MSKTKIFISSTCYDLNQVREDLRCSIIEQGHIPFLSEFPSFPVIPDLSNVENCKRNVKENTDIFILIIGGKHGSIDQQSKKSIVNLEYECAKQYGIETFIFISDKILSILPLWEKNPDADFSTHVDSTELFRFIQGIKNEQQWIFPFNKSSDIIITLKEQSSVYLKYLIDKKRDGRLEPLPEFQNETIRARQIALDKPRFWEYLLTAELLKSKFNTIEEKFDDLNCGLVFREHISVGYENLLTTKLRDLSALLRLFLISLEKIQLSWGPPGTPGDPIKIKKAVDKLIEGCIALFNWELKLKFEIVPDDFQHLKELMQGCSLHFFKQLQVLPDKLIEPLKEPSPEGTYTIKITMDSPPQLDEINREIERIGSNYM